MSDAFLNGESYNVIPYINGKRRSLAFRICFFHICNFNSNWDIKQQTSEHLCGRTVAAVYAIVPIFGVLAILVCFYNCIEFHAYPIIPSLFLKNLVTKFGCTHFCYRHISVNYRPIGIKLLSNMDNTLKNTQKKFHEKPSGSSTETVNTNIFFVFAVKL